MEFRTYILVIRKYDFGIFELFIPLARLPLVDSLLLRDQMYLLSGFSRFNSEI